MKNYHCCNCGKSTDKEILDTKIGFGCCSLSCKKEYMKTGRFKEIEKNE